MRPACGDSQIEHGQLSYVVLVLEVGSNPPNFPLITNYLVCAQSETRVMSWRESFTACTNLRASNLTLVRCEVWKIREE